jgi:hypothetical protein
MEYWSRLYVMWREPFSQVWIGMVEAVKRDAGAFPTRRSGGSAESHGDRFLVRVFWGQYGGVKTVDWGVLLLNSARRRKELHIMRTREISPTF